MLRIRKYLLKDKLIKKDMVIVNVSDIHSNLNKFREVINYINLIEPDLVTIPGDTFDSLDNKLNNEIFDFLDELSKKVNVYISCGNHDLLLYDKLGFFNKSHPTKDYRFFNDLKNKTNVNVLINNDEIYEVNGIKIIGFNPKYEWYSKTGEDKQVFRQIFTEYLNNINISDESFNILLLHSCNGLIDNNQLTNSIKNINLVLSGHNHAGITPEVIQKHSKLNRGIIGPYSKWFMTGCYGYWTKDNTSVILSNGLTKMGVSHAPKLIGNITNNILKSDIDVIELKSGNDHSLDLEKISEQK